MNKKILKQIKNEWHSNLWIFFELLLVSVILWWLVDYLFVITRIFIQPMGFDTSHCYSIYVSQEQKTSLQGMGADTIPAKNVIEIVSRLRRLPDVETVAISYAGSIYGGSTMEGPVKYDTIRAQSLYYRSVSPDYFRVFRISGANGETPEQMSKLFASHPNGIIFSENAFVEKKKVHLPSLIGRNFTLCDDTTKRVPLIALSKIVRAGDFTSQYNSRSVFTHFTEKDINKYAEISVRVKEDADVNFKDRLWRDAEKHFRVGNMFISDIKSMEEEHADYQMNEKNTIRYFIFGAVFLLLNIFLGLLGTFWFRTQQRRSELALFKALGANNANIFGREMAEGMLLLTLATIPAIIIDWNIAYAELIPRIDGLYLSAGRFIPTIVITYALIALMIFLGTLMPALKAMKIQPADALHEE